jgi:hypothetical protein
VSGVMDHHVDAAGFSDDLLGGGIGRWFRLHVEFDGAQIDAVARRATALEAFALDMTQFLSMASALRADAAMRQG